MIAATHIAAHGVILRPLDLDGDVEAMHRIFGDPASAAFLARGATGNLAETRALLEDWDTAPQWAITEAADEALGRITLIPVRHAVAEIGVMVAPAARGRRLATRAVVALTAHALAHGHIRVGADIDPDNAASVRVFERAGFAYEGRLRHHWLTHTGPADSVIYSATAGWEPPADDALSGRGSRSGSR